jgi:hypothetical protein
MPEIEAVPNFGWGSTQLCDAILTQNGLLKVVFMELKIILITHRTGFPVIPGSINGFNLQPSRPKD